MLSGRFGTLYKISEMEVKNERTQDNNRCDCDNSTVVVMVCSNGCGI